MNKAASGRTAPPGRRGRVVGHVLAVSLVVALLSFLFDLATERFLSSDVVRHMAARLFLPYDAFLYGLGSGPADRDRIVVVDIGQPTLDRYRAVWPLAYGQHARTLERLRRARPKALFIDIQFQAARNDPSLDALLRSLCAYAADGIPVFIASGAEPGPAALRPELEALRGADGKACFERVAVGYTADDADRHVWSYPLSVAAPGGHWRSAALAMAETMQGRPIEVGDGDARMGLVWGSGDELLGPGWLATAGGHHETGDHEGGTAAVARPAVAAKRHYCRSASALDLLPFVAPFRDTRPHCPMHRAVEAGTVTLPATAAQNDLLDAKIRDRAVFYGSSFDANEFLNSPLHGELPGVYLHAQATDNLLRFGDDWRRPEIFGSLGSRWEHWMAFGSFWLTALMLVASQRLLVGLGQRLGKRLGQRLGRPARDGHPRIERRRSAPARFAREVLRHVASMVARLGTFYAMLVVAVPLSLMLEHVFCISVIGYSSILAFCLLGEALTESKEWSHLLSAPAHA